MQAEGLARPCHGFLCCYSGRWTSRPVESFDWLADARFAAVHPSAFDSPVNALIEAPAFCFFSCQSNPTGAANMVSGVLITVASRGSPSSDLCTLCLQQRRGACESRSRGTQGVPVYTACLRTASTPGSIHAMPCLPCLPRRNGMPVSIVGLASCPLTSQSAIDGNSILSNSATSDLPPFLHVRSAVNSDWVLGIGITTWYPTYCNYLQVLPSTY